MVCRERAARPEPVAAPGRRAVDPGGGPAASGFAEPRAAPEAARHAAPAREVDPAVLAPAELRRVAEYGARPTARQAVAQAAPSSAARAPFHAPALAVARPVRPEVSARPVRELPPVAAYAARPLAAEAAVLRDAGAAGAAVQPDAAVGAAAARQDAAAEEAEAVPGAAAAAVLLPAVRAGLPSALPSAVVWASRQDRVLPWLAPPRSAPTVRAMAWPPVAWPSTRRSWQAA